MMFWNNRTNKKKIAIDDDSIDQNDQDFDKVKMKELFFNGQTPRDGDELFDTLPNNEYDYCICYTNNSIPCPLIHMNDISVSDRFYQHKIQTSNEIKSLINALVDLMPVNPHYTFDTRNIFFTEFVLEIRLLDKNCKNYGIHLRPNRHTGICGKIRPVLRWVGTERRSCVYFVLEHEYKQNEGDVSG